MLGRARLQHERISATGAGGAEQNPEELIPDKEGEAGKGRLHFGVAVHPQERDHWNQQQYSREKQKGFIGGWNGQFFVVIIHGRRSVKEGAVDFICVSLQPVAVSPCKFSFIRIGSGGSPLNGGRDQRRQLQRAPLRSKTSTRPGSCGDPL